MTQSSLLSLAPVDLVIIAVYFVMVLGIGFYLKRYTNTGEDFFLAGREMTAWVAGPELPRRQSRLARTDGLGRGSLSVRHPGHALVLDRRDSGHAVPRHRDDAVLLHLENALGPRLSAAALRRAGRALSAVSFALMTVLMSGINMYSMALVMKVVLGWDINFSIWVSSLTVAVYVVLGGLLSAIFNEVLQFVSDLAGRAADPDPRPDRSRRLERHGATHRDQLSRARTTRICGARWDRSPTTRWESTGPASCSASAG